MALPPPKMSAATIPVLVVFLLFWVVVGANIAGAGGSVDETFSLIGGGVILFGVVLILYALTKTIKIMRAPLETKVVVIVSRRKDVQRSGDDSTTTDYYLTAASRDGSRVEHHTTGKVYGKALENDIGIAYLRADYLIGFRRSG